MSSNPLSTSGTGIAIPVVDGGASFHVELPPPPPIETINSPLNGEQPLFVKVGYQDIQTLEGRLLTLVDASFTDPQQRKAFKDMLRRELWFHWVPYLDGNDNKHCGMPNR